MARKSRKTFNLPTTSVQTQDTLYKVGIYARVSKEDEREERDCSVETQVEIIRHYIEEKPFFQIYKIYKDNGFTGTNFQRDAFVEMMEDVKKGNINCIIVKDLSRFGRNYIEVVNYIEKIFPFFNLRFISVNDNFDTFSPNVDKEMLAVYLKTLLHDSYTRNLSTNIKAVLDTKRKNGVFIGNYPPYGYMWHPEKNRSFAIDENVAPVVRRIFTMCDEGFSYGEIAKKLNEENILSPSNYQFITGRATDKRYEKKSYWTTNNITNILTCELKVLQKDKKSTKKTS